MCLRNKSIFKLLGLLLPLLVFACGFKPMYGKLSGSDPDLVQLMADIRVDQITSVTGRQERLSQLLRNNIPNKISPVASGGSSIFSLKASYQVDEEGYGIREDESITLQNLKLLVAYQLVDMRTDTVVLDGNARAIVTYDLVQSDFSNQAARQSSLSRLSEEAANQIVTRIGTFLKNNPTVAQNTQ